MGPTPSPQPGKKADFDEIYNSPDARAYYRVLGSHGYEIPQHGADAFAPLRGERAAADGADTTAILDLCCSYGVGAALLKSDLGLDDLYAHYRRADEHGVSGEELARMDAELLDEHRIEDPPRVIGLDVARPAIDYAVTAGLLDDGLAENLEIDDPSAHLVGLLSNVGLITTTGGVGYVTEKTFTRLLDAAEHPPWVAAFCLGIYDFEPIAEVLSDHGLVTERSGRRFRQRRFANGEERRWALAELAARGEDPGPSAAEDAYFAQLFVARPADLVADRPLAELLPELV